MGIPSSEERRKDKLRLASTDLLYEIDMFDSTARALILGLAGKSRMTNSLVESFAIHARNILYFLYADRPDKDEVTASKYFDGRRDWETIRQPLTDTLERAWKRADREIAHLTFSRQQVTPARKKWPVAAIHGDVFLVLNKFFAKVPDDLLTAAVVKSRKTLVATQGRGSF
jgi:hypothetical protein